MILLVLSQVQDSGAGYYRRDEGPRGAGGISLFMGHRHRQLRFRPVQKPKLVVFSHDLRTVYGVIPTRTTYTNVKLYNFFLGLLEKEICLQGKCGHFIH